MGSLSFVARWVVCGSIVALGGCAIGEEMSLRDAGRSDARMDATVSAAQDGAAQSEAGANGDGASASDAPVGPRPDGSMACGEQDFPCCAGASPCVGILVCSMGTCRTCGRSGEPCCAGDGCNSGLTCTGGRCTGCGAAGQSCCPGARPCADTATCVAGTCRQCGVEPGTCVPGTMGSERCGNCGTRTRLCNADCSWGAWGACGGAGACAAGATESRACGFCGTQTRRCAADCSWELWSACTGSRDCAPGTVDTTGCGTCGQRTCGADCRWPAACSGCRCDARTQCGFTCPTGYHPSGFSCNFSWIVLGQQQPGRVRAGLRRHLQRLRLLVSDGLSPHGIQLQFLLWIVLGQQQPGLVRSQRWRDLQLLRLLVSDRLSRDRYEL
ncbi:MAG: hypothetical protein U0269_07045 [Polyangiales bacterium]